MGLKKFFKQLTKKGRQVTYPSKDPHVVPRAEHQISRKNIHRNALKVLYRLQKAGYQAFLVGGGVRDLLLGKHPKDFDVATDARPNQVKKLFRNCRLIGRRFRLAHIHYRDSTIEVSTFRGNPPEKHHGYACSEHGMVMRDNVYGSMEEDAWRRDFTINALYYNIADFSVMDFVGGMRDLQQGVIHIIGNPTARYREDPVRMLRAIRFAAKLDMTIEKNTAKPITQLAPLLLQIAPSRLFEETLKIFHCGHAARAFQLLRQYELLDKLLPQTNEALTLPLCQTFIEQGLKDTDARIQQKKTTAIPFLFALLCWHACLDKQQRLQEQGMAPATAFDEAVRRVVRIQNQRTSIPKRLQWAIIEILTLQRQLEERRHRRIHGILSKPRFRAAFDVFSLRSQTGEVSAEAINWWQKLQKANQSQRHDMIQALTKTQKQSQGTSNK